MVSVQWLIAGAVLLALEAFGIPGIGFLFAGIAAVIVGGFVELGVIDPLAATTQWGVFFLTTTLLAVLLWKKLKTWRMNPNAPHYSNIVGTEAIVTQPLVGDAVGEVRWSGTLMRARLAAQTVAELPVGATVIIREADGNILLVAPK
jgi:membrane protein implicated in regulation of membrane protease activity